MVHRILDELQGRWRAMFRALAAGDDLPPGRRLRAEGLMEAAVLGGLATEAELQRAMGACYLEAFGRALEDDFGEDWPAFHPFPEIPAAARRAPVSASAGDAL